MCLKNIIAKQFRKPSGLLGKYSSGFMIKRNTSKIEWAIDACDIQENDIVLEIGFGPGIGIEKTAALVKTGKIYGIDFSKDMVKKASRHNKVLIAENKVELQFGDLCPTPFANSFFDKIFAVNVIYFWPTPKKELQEILRILKPGKKAVFYLSDKYTMQKLTFTNTSIFNTYTADEFTSIVKEAGFTNVTYETKIDIVNGAEFKGHCVMGFKRMDGCS